VRQDYLRPNRKDMNTRSHLHHNARAFHSRRRRQRRPNRVFAFDRVQIRRIDRRSRHLHHHLIRLRFRPGALDHAQNFGGISVRFVDRGLKRFAHSAAGISAYIERSRQQYATIPTAARTALLGMVTAQSPSRKMLDPPDNP
jgi:hypothetical protein